MKLFRVLVIFSLFALSECGVKGRPLPPLEPREIGIGRPQYSGLDKDLKESDEESKSKSKKAPKK